LGIQQRGTGETIAKRAIVGETVGMMWHKSARNTLLAMSFASLWVSGCGSSSSANRIVVTVTGQFSVMVPTQTQTITSNVTGATDVSSTFTCSYTTTANPTTSVPNPKPSASADCATAKIPAGDPDAGTPAVGTLTPIASTGTTSFSTATFLAPKDFPDQKVFPNVVVTITATSNADKKTTGKFNLVFDSGVHISLSPATATVAALGTEQFFAKDANGNLIPNDKDHLAWILTFETTGTTSSVSCSGGSNDCGSIAPDANGIETYTAPSKPPTASTAKTPTQNAAGIVTVFVYSTIDNTRHAQASVTVVTAGPITFSGISPSEAPQGGLQQDIFLAAINATSQLGVTLVPPGATCPRDTAKCIPLDSTQIKVVFPAGSSSASIGARIRLNSAQLATAGQYKIQVTSPNPSVNVTGGPFPLNIVPVRPTVVSATPNNFQEAALGLTAGIPFVVDGGFFGPPATPVVTPKVNGQSLLANTNTQSQFVPSARRIVGTLPSNLSPSANAGLFPVSVQYAASPGPTATTAYTNIAVIPDYGNHNPAKLSTPIALPSTSAPSAIAVDSLARYAVVTFAGLNTMGGNVNTQNNVQFINLSGVTPALASAVPSRGNLATSVAVDDQLHIAAVVNYASHSLSILSIPSGTFPSGLAAPIDLSQVIPPPNTTPPTTSFTEPFPYSVGIDPFSHRALVAFASTNVGLIVNLDSKASVTCLSAFVNATAPYCPIAYVTLGSGSAPQVAFEPGARLAYVTPGGAGLLSAVSLASPSTESVKVTGATRSSNLVTVTTATSHNLDPGNPGTVLISGLPPGTKGTNFDGSFSVNTVLDSTHFQYIQPDLDDSTTCTTTSTPPCSSGNANAGNPFLTYSISSAITGISFNSVTRQAILVDPNATSGQVTYIDPQSESVTSMTLFANATGQGTGSTEIGASAVAFQPLSNTAVSFNPNLNQVSLLDPSLLQRAAIVGTGQKGLGTVTYCLANCTPPATPTNVTVPIPGAVAVDSVNNLVLVANSGNDSISVLQLGNIKAVHIETVQTPPIDAASANFKTPASLSPAVKITLGTPPTAVSGVKIFGAGFDSGSQVLLDGVVFASSALANFSFVDAHEIDVTIPLSVLNAGPRHYALSVTNSSGVSSNVSDFTVLEEIPLQACNVTSTNPPTIVPAAPGGVAIDEVNNLAVVTNTGAGCGQVSVFSLNPSNIFNQTVKPIPTGDTPTGVAVFPSLAYIGQVPGTHGVALVTNNGSNSVSVIDLVNAAQVMDTTKTPPVPLVVNVDTGPSGVAIDDQTNLAVIANTTSGTVSTIDLTPIAQDPNNSSKKFGALTPGRVAVDPNPIAVAIDPDRGTNGRGLAVVTCLQPNGASSPFGELVGVDIGSTTPVRSTSASTSFLSATPTGVVFDPSVVTGTANPGLFYAVSTQGNVITTFNPDTSQTQAIKVGINPNAIAHNFQTGTILTVNSLSNSISIVDSQTFATKATLGIGGTSKFAAAIQTSTNLAVIADHDNNRVLLFPLPK
jgi:DNA-binding beta-propeller fold protein YncE